MTTVSEFVGVATAGELFGIGLPLFLIFLLVYELNGILLPILLVLMIRLANDKRLMGEHVNGRVANGLSSGTALLLIVLTALLVLDLWQDFNNDGFFIAPARARVRMRFARSR